MTENRNHKSISSFFSLLGIGFIILCIKVKIKEMPPIESVRVLFFTFGYIYVISIWFGLAGMLTVDIYLQLKKKLEKGLIYDAT